MIMRAITYEDAVIDAQDSLVQAVEMFNRLFQKPFLTADRHGRGEFVN